MDRSETVDANPALVIFGQGSIAGEPLRELTARCVDAHLQGVGTVTAAMEAGKICMDPAQVTGTPQVTPAAPAQPRHKPRMTFAQKGLYILCAILVFVIFVVPFI